MASHLRASLRATPTAAAPVSCIGGHPIAAAVPVRRGGGRGASRIRASDGGASYLDMWKKAVDRDRKAMEFHQIAEKSGVDDSVESVGALGRKSDEFMKILEVPKEERDRVQRMQVIDRAAAAIAAARAILQESKVGSDAMGQSGVGGLGSGSGGGVGSQHGDNGMFLYLCRSLYFLL